MNHHSPVPVIPPSAPFSEAQIGWLNGFLAGMYSTGGNVYADQTVAESKETITILWGSQTGNAETLARKAGKSLAANGFNTKIIDSSEYDPAGLSDENVLLLLTSTYGEGEPPDNIESFHQWLHSEEAPRLEQTRFSVLALGDSNYVDFCKCGVEFDKRLKALGAEPLIPLVECDADFDAPFAQWLEAVTRSLQSSDSSLETEDPASKEDNSFPVGAYGKSNHFPAKILRNRNLNGDGSAKETRHIEISIEASGLEYEPGDAVAIIPENCPLDALQLIQAAGFNGSELVFSLDGKDLPLREALIKGYDISNLSLKSATAYAAIANNEALNALMEDREAFKEYAWGRQLIDLISDYPTPFESPEQLLSVFPKLAPRLYSISSSLKAHPGEVHATVGVVRYESHGRERKGVCSSFLAEHGGDSPIQIFFHHSNSFKLPNDNSLPVIMVGPGTGIAPFRAFLEERNAREAKGKNWLFFGDQHASVDFLYKEEIERYFVSGLLTRFDTAFSRDQETKIYVQDRMREHGKELYKWLEEGACFYVCGDASRMAKDVEQALLDIISEQSGRGPAGAAEYVKKLKAEKRYLRDVY